jgi:hypothetical protein
MRSGESRTTDHLGDALGELTLTQQADAVAGGSNFEYRDVRVADLDASAERVSTELVEQYARTREWVERRIDVVRRGGRYIVVDGHHRATAAAKAGAATVPARVYDPPVSL